MVVTRTGSIQHPVSTEMWQPSVRVDGGCVERSTRLQGRRRARRLFTSAARMRGTPRSPRERLRCGTGPARPIDTALTFHCGESYLNISHARSVNGISLVPLNRPSSPTFVNSKRMRRRRRSATALIFPVRFFLSIFFCYGVLFVSNTLFMGWSHS